MTAKTTTDATTRPRPRGGREGRRRHHGGAAAVRRRCRGFQSGAGGSGGAPRDLARNAVGGIPVRCWKNALKDVG
ncbi:Uncharacterised protein [Mycobacterium tuberculosis]|nr:Uncharacterised protein [Mycobacterium tuberculosis]